MDNVQSFDSSGSIDSLATRRAHPHGLRLCCGFHSHSIPAPLIARIDAEENLLRAQFGDEYSACSHVWRLIPGLYYQIRTGKVALFDGSWIVPAARKVGSGKYAKWLLFHLHQLQKFAQ